VERWEGEEAVWKQAAAARAGTTIGFLLAKLVAPTESDALDRIRNTLPTKATRHHTTKSRNTGFLALQLLTALSEERRLLMTLSS
jgi:hypothetical protein